MVVDPGFGFGKTDAHNLELLARLDESRAFGRPLLVGLSRKGTIGQADRAAGGAAGGCRSALLRSWPSNAERV